MKTASVVRLACAADEEPLLALLRQMHSEMCVAPFDDDSVRGVLQRGIARELSMIGVIRGPEEIEASIGLFIGGLWYSSGKHLQDLWMYVSQPHRRTNHAKSMVAFAKHCSSEIGIPLIMGVLAKPETAPKVKLYQRQLQPLGSMSLFSFNA